MLLLVDIRELTGIFVSKLVACFNNIICMLYLYIILYLIYW